MPFETILTLVTTTTVKTVTKFLYEKVENFIRNKFYRWPIDDFAQLKKSLEELKSQVISYQGNEIPQDVVEKVKEIITRIEENKSPLPVEEISSEAFLKWSKSDEVDIEDQTMVQLRELEIFIEEAKDSNINNEKRYQLQDITASLEINLKVYRQAKFNARLSGLSQDEQDLWKAERQLRRNLFQARDFLK